MLALTTVVQMRRDAIGATCGAKEVGHLSIAAEGGPGANLFRRSRWRRIRKVRRVANHETA